MLTKTKRSTITIGIIGLGRIGLPLTLVLADRGFKTLGIDQDLDKITQLKKGKMPFQEKGAAVLLKKHLGKNLNFASIEDIKACQVVIICVGTYLKPDLTPDSYSILNLIKTITPYLKKDVLVVLRSTVQPKATAKINAYFKKLKKSSIKLVYAPERIAEGQALKELLQIPQIIGSYDSSSARQAAEIFSTFAPEILHTDPLSAELSKLILNTHRYANFAIANELMMIVNHYDRDIHKILKLANQNYLRGNLPKPGFAAGPCLVKDSYFLKHSTPFNTLITGSYYINNELVNYLCQQINKRSKIKGKKIAVLGLSFKKNIDDDRDSLSIKLLKQLKKYSSNITYHDPYLANTNLSEVLVNATAVILAVDHDEYKKMTLNDLKQYTKTNSLICDIWNIYDTDQIFFNLAPQIN